MMKHADLFRKAGALALSAGISTIMGDMGAGLVTKFLSDLAGKYLENLELDKLKAVVHNQHPSDLNHHLRKALQQAINQALTNIQILYADQLRYDHQKKATKGLIDQLRAGVESALLSASTETDRGVIELIDTKTVNSSDELRHLLDSARDEFPAIDETNPLSSFIKKQFVPQLQLCFGEELKKPQQHEAWVAYQRLLLRELKQTTEETLTLGREANRKLDELANQQLGHFPRVSKERLASLQNLLQTLDNTEIRLEDRFQSALDAWVNDLRSQMTEMVVISRETGQKVDLLRIQVGHASTTVQTFDRTLRQNWVSKYWLALSITAGVLLTAIMVIYTHFQSQPFDLTMFAQPNPNLSLATDYPAFTGGELVLRLGNKEERKPLPPQGEVVIKQIPASLQGATVSVRLIARNWRVAQDSITLMGKTLSLSLIPDGSLGILTGNVLNEAMNPVAGAAVTINNDTTVFTNRRGIFHLVLPFRLQHDRYNLKIDKPGYKSRKGIYYPKSGNIDIQLVSE